tara:strand:+ start:559 stop:2310 length:1752 start_codon:yes stop_codon:yes gene_type:complete
MKVPLYDATPRRQTGGTGGALTVQASAQVLARENPLQSLGDTLVEFGFEKARIKNESQAANSVTAAEQDMQDILDKYDRDPVDSVSEDIVLQELDGVVNNYLGVKINPLTKKPFLESKTSKQLFVTSVQKSLSKFKLGFRKSHGAKLLAVAKEKTIRGITTDVNEIIATDNQQDGLKMLDSLITTETTGVLDEFGQTSVKYKGTIPNALSKGYLDVKGSIEVSESALKNIVTGRTRKLFFEGEVLKTEPEDVVKELRLGVLEDDVVLKAFSLLDEDARANILTNLLNEASQLEDEKFQAEQAKEDQVKADNDELKRTIINYDPNDEDSVAGAAQAFEKLRRDNGFATVAEINAFRDLLNPDDDKKDDKSTTAAYTALTNLDANNQLTVDAINRVYASGQLTNADYKFFMKAFTGEVAQGYRNAQKLIKNSVNFDVAAANLNDTNELKLELASEYLIKLDKWANTVPTTTDLESGGQGAGYQAYRRYAIKLSEELGEDVMEKVQKRFDVFARNFAQLAATLFKGPEFSGIELDLSTGNKRQAILDYLDQIKATPDGVNKLKSALGFKAQVEVFLQNYASEEGLR